MFFNLKLAISAKLVIELATRRFYNCCFPLDCHYFTNNVDF